MALMQNVGNTLHAASISKAFSQGYKDNFSVEGQSRRTEMQALKLQRENELKKIQQVTGEDLVNEVELDRQTIKAQLAQVGELQNQLLQQQIYRGFDRYVADPNPRHLNTMITEAKRTEAGSQLFGQVVRVDALTESDRDLIQKAGLDPDVILNDPEVSRSFVKSVKSDGSIVIDSVDTIQQMSGYGRYVDQRELDRQTKIAEIMYRSSRTGATTELERQAQRLAESNGLTPDTPEYTNFVAQYIQEQQDKKTGPRLNSAREREADRYARTYGEPGSDEYAQAFQEKDQEIVQRERQTSKSRELDEVEDAKSRIDGIATETFETDFFSIDLSKRENRLRFENDIRRIARLGGADLGATELSELSNVRQLIALGEPSVTLSDAETGLIDNTIKGLKRYFSNDVSGTQERAAYNTFRNTIRHSFYGSALTEHEIKSMNQQLGTLSQQAGPVLAQFRIALETVKSRLESLFNTNDSYVMQFYAGADQEKLAQIITALDDRIDFVDSVQTGGTIRLPDSVVPPTPEPNTPSAEQGALQSMTPERREELMRILAGGNQ